MRLMVKDKEIAKKVCVANSFASRCLGLMGRKSMAAEECLWIHSCNQIHTHFMRFAIDVIFVDANMKVLKIKSHIKPWRFTLPVLGADSVFEFMSQEIHQRVQEGDHLHVGT
jgi:uncharacterized membrane protein (UPF0127 family)